jgi:hypothetical protein
MKRAFAALVLVLAVPSCKKGLGSGFEGEITLHTTRGSDSQDMIIKTKQEKLRFETNANGKSGAAIFDPAQNKVIMLLDDQKAYMEMDFSAPSAPQANVDAKAATAEKTGKKETVAGIDCEDWTVKDPSGKHTEVCLADGLAFFDLDGVKGGSSTSSFSKQLREKKQFPLKSVDYDAAGKEVSRTEATKIEKKKLDDGLFQVPSGYQKLSLPGMK